MKADLHLHTHYSDGTDSPARVVERAAALKFDWLAITDHDTMGGVAEALEAGQKNGVRVVPGVEITAQHRQRELHLLAYFRSDKGADDGWRHPDLAQQLETDVKRRWARAEQIVRRLNGLGVPLTMEEVSRQARAPAVISPSGSAPILRNALGRPHVAAALCAAGHVGSVDEAFARYLKKGRSAWVDKERAGSRAVISLVHRIGGIIVLAHPGLISDEAMPDHLRQEGIDGVEAFHPRHAPARSARLQSWAHANNLLATGGSDCHGMLKGEPLLGRVELCGGDLDRFLERLTGP